MIDEAWVGDRRRKPAQSSHKKCFVKKRFLVVGVLLILPLIGSWQLTSNATLQGADLRILDNGGDDGVGRGSSGSSKTASPCPGGAAAVPDNATMLHSTGLCGEEGGWWGDQWRSDGKGGRVRVMIMFIGTHPTPELCQSLLSAHLSGVSVVVAGYRGVYTNMRKLPFAVQAAKQAGLTGRDVVIVLDGDTFFTGENVIPFVDNFIVNSPETPNLLNVAAVRGGGGRRRRRDGQQYQMAPVLVSAEANCYAPLTFGDLNCIGSYDEMYQKVNRHHWFPPSPNTTSTGKSAASQAEDGDGEEREEEGVAPTRYVNSGAYIARLWALEEVSASSVRHTSWTLFSYGGVHECDQSVIADLYVDLRLWEVHCLAPTLLTSDDTKHELPSKTQLQKQRLGCSKGLQMRADTATTAKSQKGIPVSQYGLRAGILAVDTKNEMSIVPYNWTRALFELSSERWCGRVCGQSISADENALAVPRTMSIVHNGTSAAIDAFIAELYHTTARRCTGISGDGCAQVKFRRQPLSPSPSHRHGRHCRDGGQDRKRASHGTLMDNVELAPALLSVKPRDYLANGSRVMPPENSERQRTRIFPLLMHFAGPNKVHEMDIATHYMQWYIALQQHTREGDAQEKQALRRRRDALLEYLYEHHTVALWGRPRAPTIVNYGDFCRASMKAFTSWQA